MSTGTQEIVIQNEGQEITYPPKLVEVIKNTVAKKATDDELYMFLSLAQSYGLDPFKKEIWFIKYNGETRIETGRDGYLSIAKRDPDYINIQSFAVHENDEFRMEIEQGEVKNVIHNFGIDRGEIKGAWAVVRYNNKPNMYEFLPFDESNQNSPVWKKHKTLMMKKVVESVLLKRSAGISGLVTAEEMGTDVERYTDEKRGRTQGELLQAKKEREQAEKEEKQEEEILDAEFEPKVYDMTEDGEESEEKEFDWDEACSKNAHIAKYRQLLEDTDGEVTADNVIELALDDGMKGAQLGAMRKILGVKAK